MYTLCPNEREKFINKYLKEGKIKPCTESPHATPFCGKKGVALCALFRGLAPIPADNFADEVHKCILFNIMRSTAVCSGEKKKNKITHLSTLPGICGTASVPIKVAEKS